MQKEVKTLWKHIDEMLSVSDAPILPFSNRSDTDTILVENGQC